MELDEFVGDPGEANVEFCGDKQTAELLNFGS
jgi:hypothetical protein